MENLQLIEEPENNETSFEDIPEDAGNVVREFLDFQDQARLATTSREQSTRRFQQRTIPNVVLTNQTLLQNLVESNKLLLDEGGFDYDFLMQHQDRFDGIKELYLIDINIDNFNEDEAKAESFLSKFKNLKKLHLYNCHIHFNFPTKQLEELYLINHDEEYYLEESKTLKKLVIIQEIFTLTDEMSFLQHFPNLEYFEYKCFDMRNSDIHEWEDKFLETKEPHVNLKCLKLNVDVNLFDVDIQVPNLLYLDINKSFITSLPPGLTKLKFLNANNSGLRTLPADIIDIEYLGVSNCNNILNIPRWYSNLKYLDIRNEINFYDIHNNSLKYLVGNVVHIISANNLVYAKVNVLNKNDDTDLSNLQYLDFYPIEQTNFNANLEDVIDLRPYPKLKYLNNRSVWKCVHYPSSLQYLHINTTTSKLPHNLRNLKILDIAASTFISYIPLSYTKLTDLIVKNNDIYIPDTLNIETIKYQTFTESFHSKLPDSVRFIHIANIRQEDPGASYAHFTDQIVSYELRYYYQLSDYNIPYKELSDLATFTNHERLVDILD